MKVSINQQQFRSAKSMLAGFEKDSTPALVRALNKALTGVRTDMTKAATDELNLKAKDVRDAIAIKKPNYSNLSAHVKRTGKPVPLSKFIGTKATGKGYVSVKVKKTGKRVLLKHAFMATMKSGHVGVFQRKKGPHTNTRPFRPGFNYAALPKKPYRLPVEELTGPRIEDILAKPAVIGKIETLAGQRFEKNMDHELNRLLGSL